MPNSEPPPVDEDDVELTDRERARLHELLTSLRREYDGLRAGDEQEDGADATAEPR